MMTNVMLKTYLNQKNIKSSSLIQAMKNSVCPKAKFIRRPSFPKSELSEVSELCYGFSTRHDNREVTLIQFFESRICPNIYRMFRSFRSFRSVDWTHDMIIVKWHLFIWHERKLCALTNAPPVQSTQTGQLLSTLFHANCSSAQVFVLHPGQFIFALRCRRRSFLQVLQSTERLERYFEKFFVYLMMTNVMMKTCLNHKIIKISNLIQAMKNSVCPKAKVIRRPNISERRISPNINRMFRSVDGVDWTHDMIIAKWHLFIWHERELCALTNASPVQSTQTGQWLSTLFHANCSAAQVYVLYPRQFIFAISCRRRPFSQVLQSTEG